MQRIVTFKIDENLLNAIDRFATRRGMARSELIREALITLLAEEEAKRVSSSGRSRRREYLQKARLLA